jgi:hypothetical protein
MLLTHFRSFCLLTLLPVYCAQTDGPSLDIPGGRDLPSLDELTSGTDDSDLRAALAEIGRLRLAFVVEPFFFMHSEPCSTQVPGGHAPGQA